MNTPQDDIPKSSAAESKQDVTLQVTPLASEGSGSAPHSSSGSEAQSPPTTQEGSVGLAAGAAVAAAASVEPNPPPPKPVIVRQPESFIQVGTPIVTQTPPPPPDQVGASAVQGSSETSDVVDVEGAFTKASVGDTVAVKDSIGFEPYVQAVAEFLADPDTEPPLTISVEGEWGAGKSSFMKQLERALDARGIASICFNAWRYDKDESLWAAFAIEFPRALARRLSLFKRLIPAIRLWAVRFDWLEGWYDLFIFTSKVLIYICIIAFLVGLFWYGRSAFESVIGAANDSVSHGKMPPLPDWLWITSGGGTVLFTGVLELLRRMKEQVGNPFAIELRRFSEAPDYSSRVSFVERFHEDFKKIVEVYVGEGKLCVFIDDLDRCEVPKSADLMQALNLMIPDSPNLIFVLGMDRQRVAAAVAVKNEKILPFLTCGSVMQGHESEGKPKQGVDPFAGLAYGYEFLEKFIQIPFRLPQTNKDGVESLLDELLKKRTKPAESSWWMALRGEPRKPAPKPKSASSPQGPTVQSGEKASPLKESLQRSERQVTLMVASALDYNPRRLKQFLNAYRLKAYIAYMTHILDVSEGAPQNGRLSLPQVAKFVAISLRWPLLLSSLDEDRQLLSRLQRMAIKERRPSPIPDLSRTSTAVPSEESVSEELSPWTRNKALMGLLFEGCSSSHDEPRFSLQIVDLDKLLRISPRRKEPAMDIQASRDT